VISFYFAFGFRVDAVKKKTVWTPLRAALREDASVVPADDLDTFLL
jgi:hypothetical protein